MGVSLLWYAAMHEAELRHPHFFFRRDQDGRVFADDGGGPHKGQGCLLIPEHLIHHVDRARVLERETPLPVRVARVSGPFGSVTEAVVRPPVLPVKPPAQTWNRLKSLAQKLKFAGDPIVLTLKL